MDVSVCAAYGMRQVKTERRSNLHGGGAYCNGANGPDCDANRAAPQPNPGAVPGHSPEREIPPGEAPSTGYFGNGTMWTLFWPDGKVIFQTGGPGEVEADGSLSMKWPWWHSASGKLTIDGRRLGGSAPPLKADIPQGYDLIGFQATALIFSTPGCWEVTGRVGDTSLTFVTQVVYLGKP